MSKQQKNINKEFKLSSWAIDNPSVVYVMIGIFFFLGLSAYFDMPREDFPEIKETKIYISTPYPGNTAEDIERLITDPLEDKLKNISNVVEITSTSQEDYAIITVEFDEDISVESAKQKVKDEVDSEKASEDWPTFNGAKVEPNVFDLNISEEIAIMNINLTGDYPVEKLKAYGEYLEDLIEDLPQIKKVDIRGAQEKEVEIAVDVYKMMASKVSFNDILQAIGNGNMTLSAGNLVNSGQRRTIRIIGEIETPEALENFIIKSENGAVYLRDVANIAFKDKEKTTYARKEGQSVVMLEVKKRAGKNMIQAADEIKMQLNQSSFNETIAFENGLFNVMGTTLSYKSPIVDLTVKEAKKKFSDVDFITIAIKREGVSQTIIPRGDTKYEVDDQVYFSVPNYSIKKLYPIIGKKHLNIKNVMILGGSSIGEKTARNLCEDNFKVTLIEKNKEKAAALAEELGNTLVINGDGRDLELLEEENISEMDAFIAVTGNSETNIISSLVAKNRGVKKTIALVENMDYFELSHSIGIDTLINKKLLAANKIFRYIRKGDVVAMTKLSSMNAELLEFIVKPNSKICNKVIKDLNFPLTAIIGGVIRDGEGMLALGDFNIEAGDRVVVCCLPASIKKVESFFF